MEESTGIWNVLVVDDEPDMLTITKMALDGFYFLGSTVFVHTAKDVASCKQVLESVPEIAVVFMDVVMEEDDTGFKLIHYIREVCGNKLTRIIIRTGQPGKAPLMEAVRKYDINDYKEKTELTVEKLRVSLMTALRSWRQMMEIELNRSILHHLVDKNPILFRTNSLRQFSGAVFEQLSPLLHLMHPEKPHDILFAVDSHGDKNLDWQDGIGAFAGKGDEAYQLPEDLKREILATDRFRFHDGGFSIQVGSFLSSKGYLHIRGIPKLGEWNGRLIQLFIGSISAAFDNLLLRKESDATQREIILNLGELLEARSGETVFHVHRVSAIVQLLARNWGADPQDIEMLGLASAFHDIGKIVIPEFILNKPGPLCAMELEIMKTHAKVGKDILSKSSRPLFKLAAVMAGQHHERYDGSGYPDGLKGKVINRYGRILALADVYDALSHDRVYKKAWPEEEVLEYIRGERGKHFDPELVDLFFSIYDEVSEITKHKWENIAEAAAQV